jgi:uncharacterized membrane protein
VSEETVDDASALISQTQVADEEVLTETTSRVNAALARVHERGPELVVLLAVTVFVIVFGRLVILRHNQFRTIDFDLGIHDQSIWLLSRLKSFCTVRGLPVFGHHATFGYILLLPLAWLGAGPNVWNVLQVVALASGAFPLFQLARMRTSNAWLAVVPALVWLFQPPLQAFAWETFHPEVMAMPFLLWAYLAGERKHWRTFTGLIIVTMCWKEDLALAVVGLGLYYLVRNRRRIGAYLMAGGLAWFVIFGAILVPREAGGKTVYGGLYGDLGETSAQVAKTAVLHPNRIVRRLVDNNAGTYVRDLIAPTGFTPLAAPGALLIGLPQAAVNLLTLADFTRDLRYHYSAIPLVSTGVGMVEGIAFFYKRRRAWGRAVTGFAAAAALTGTVVWGLSPLGQRYETGYWPLLPTNDREVREQSLRLIGPTDGVAADYFMVPHLTHRPIAYTFPNPWANKNYGISAASLGDPTLVKWLAADKALMGDDEITLFNQILANGEFVVRLESGSFVLAERVQPPS